jgi:signal transduction histidine kinase
MDMPFLFGVLGAWAVAQIGMGILFVLAHALAERQNVFLLFGVLCFALAVTSSGIAWGHAIQLPEEWQRPATLTHAGAIVAAALNLHFVLRFGGVARAGRIAFVAYALAGAAEMVLWSGNWWVSGALSVREGAFFGSTIRHVTARPTALGLAGYAIAASELVLSQVLLFRSYLAGKREAIYSCIGAVFIVAAMVNDIALVTGNADDTVYMTPHAFMLYAAGVAITLFFRHRVAAGELAQVETTLRETTEELRHSHAELKVLQDELVRKRELAAVGELAAAIAHEVRNPLAIIVNALASLRRAGIREEDRQMLLGIVDEETARLNRLVDDLLRFARPVNVQRANVVLSELAQRSQAVAREHDVSVAVEQDAPAQVPGDANLLRIALDNLVDNACHALSAGSGVEIVLGKGELEGVPAARIEVRDQGHGMGPDVLERALDPFFTTRPSGTGLGLPIVQRITEAHGGKLRLDSEIGRGTTATLLLPLEPASAELTERRA